MAKILDGRFAARAWNPYSDTRKTLAIISIGDDPASKIYVRNKIRACEQANVEVALHSFGGNCTQEFLEYIIRDLNRCPDIDGILVQLPLPPQINEKRIMELIHPVKDVDGFHPYNMGRLAAGDPAIVPCTPKGIMQLLRTYDITVEGKHVVIVGRSNIVGKPLAMLMLNADATVTICHSHTKDLPSLTKQADILVSAVGKPHFITADMVKDGAVVIDVGINRVNGKLVGDVDFDAVSQVASYITSVPGGVGQMTVAALLDNMKGESL